MKLTDLEPEFLRIKSETAIDTKIESLDDAQGVMFLCPVCFQANGGNVGTHSVMCWFRDREVPDSQTPGPGRWTPSGTGFEDLSLTPSVLLPTAECAWHGWVTNGEVL